MNQFGGYEGNESNDALLDMIVPKIGAQIRGVLLGTPSEARDQVVAIVVFLPDPECRAAHLSDVIAMMERRGELAIAKLLRTEKLGPDEHWMAIQRVEASGGVIVMAKIKLGEIDRASLLN